MTPGRWVTPIILAVAIVAGALTIRWAYNMGRWAGYSDGWSDAHCGPGNGCEAGQD